MPANVIILTREERSRRTPSLVKLGQGAPIARGPGVTLLLHLLPSRAGKIKKHIPESGFQFDSGPSGSCKNMRIPTDPYNPDGRSSEKGPQMLVSLHGRGKINTKNTLFP